MGGRKGKGEREERRMEDGGWEKEDVEKDSDWLPNGRSCLRIGQGSTNLLLNGVNYSI